MPDLLSMADDIGTLLKARGDTIAVSESSTGGLISAALLGVPGASEYFVGGAVVYTQASREVFLGIDLVDHPGMRSASEPYAALCAKTIREQLGTVWGLAETGASGPTGNRYGDAAGHSCMAVNGPLTMVETLETGSADREANMWMFAEKALSILNMALSAG